MRILIYSARRSRWLEELLNRLKEAMGSVEIEMIRRVDFLQKRLVVSRANTGAIVLVISDDRQLEAMMNLRDLLLDTRLILVLHALEGSDLSRAHQLHPRYLADTNTPATDVAAVLTRIVQHQSQDAAQKDVL